MAQATPYSYTERKRIRKSFGKRESVLNVPYLLTMQKDSYVAFLQKEVPPRQRKPEGLQAAFLSAFPIVSHNGFVEMKFLEYNIAKPAFDVRECQQRGLTFAAAVRARLQMIIYDREASVGQSKVVKEVKEQEVYMGEVPLMTDYGSFIVNGTERVIVSQLHRSPGVFFAQSKHTNGTKLYSARVIPMKGSWIEFATDINSVMFAYIDRKKKLPVTTLLRAIGFESDKDILEIFDLADEIKVSKSGLKKIVGRKLAARVLKTWVEDFVDEDTGEVVSIERNEVILERDSILDEEAIEMVVDMGVESVFIQREDVGGDFAIIYNTLNKDTSNSELEAVQFIYRQLRGADAPDNETARGIIDKLFFSDKRYDLGEVGRYKINRKLNVDDVFVIRQHQRFAQFLVTGRTALSCAAITNLERTHLLHVDHRHALDRIRHMPARTRHGGFHMLAEAQHQATRPLIDNIETRRHPDQRDQSQHGSNGECIATRPVGLIARRAVPAKQAIQFAAELAHHFIQIGRSGRIAARPRKNNLPRVRMQPALCRRDRGSAPPHPRPPPRWVG